jgi:hypothetical protein
MCDAVPLELHQLVTLAQIKFVSVYHLIKPRKIFLVHNNELCILNHAVSPSFNDHL